MSLTRRTLLSTALAPVVSRAATPKVQVGCQTRAYGSPIPDRGRFLGVLDDLAELGYEGFETNYRSLEHSFDDPAPMRREFEKRGVELIGLHLGVGLFDPEKIAGEQEQILRIAKAVHGLGGKHIILSGRRLPTEAAGRATRAALASKARELNRAGRSCRDLGVRVSFHNHRHELAHNAEEITYMLTETDPDLVSLVLDVGHPFPPRLPATEFVYQYPNRIAGFHLRDTKAGKEVMIGSGDFDFAALGKAIRRTGWLGWLIVEVNRRGYLEPRSGREMPQPFAANDEGLDHHACPRHLLSGAAEVLNFA